MLRDVEIGLDEDGERVTSAVVEPTEPVKHRPHLSSQQKIAMQALSDATAQAGEKRPSDLFPQSRRCVQLTVWRNFCSRHSLSGGSSDSAHRKAFHDVKQALHKKGLIRIVDGWVWRCNA